MIKFYFRMIKERMDKGCERSGRKRWKKLSQGPLSVRADKSRAETIEKRGQTERYAGNRTDG